MRYRYENYLKKGTLTPKVNRLISCTALLSAWPAFTIVRNDVMIEMNNTDKINKYERHFCDL